MTHFKNNLNFFIFLYILLLSNSKLLFTNIHFRHGSRGSILLIDEEGKDLLGQKWKRRGMLTPKGKKQSFMNGIKHRERYSDFLGKEYIEFDLQPYSTDSYRAISSLESYLNGLFYDCNSEENYISDGETLFPPGNITQKMKNIGQKLGNNALPPDSQVIPMNIFQKAEHKFVLHEPEKISDCQPIRKIRKEIKLRNKYKEIVNEFKLKYGKSLENYFTENNIKRQFNYSFDEIHLFCDTLYCDLNDNRNISIPGINMDKLVESCNHILYTGQFDFVTPNREVVMMSQTPPIQKLMKWMENRIDLDLKGQSEKIKMGSPRYTIWSGHDSSLSSIQMFMKYIFGTKLSFPTFSFTIIFELHKNESDNYELRYIVNDEILIKIDYYEFKNKVTKYLWTEEQISNFGHFSIINAEIMNKSIKKYLMIIVILVIILSLSVFINVWHCIRNREKQKIN